jgi:hypothetical protein
VDRHDRQARLPGVGTVGQERISAAIVEVQSEGLAAEVAVRYLAGAGVGGLRVRDRALAAAAASIDPTVRVETETGGASASTTGDAFASTGACCEPTDEAFADLHDPTAREVARGAREALRALRAVLEGPLRIDDGRCLRIDDGRCLRIDDGRCLRIDDGRCLRIDDGRCLRIDDGRCLRIDEGTS